MSYEEALSEVFKTVCPLDTSFDISFQNENNQTFDMTVTLQELLDNSFDGAWVDEQQGVSLWDTVWITNVCKSPTE